MRGIFGLAAPRSATARGILLMLLAIFLFTAMDAAAKGLIQRYDFAQVVWARFTGQVVIVALILGRATLSALRSRYPLLHMVRSACQLGATGCFFASL